VKKILFVLSMTAVVMALVAGPAAAQYPDAADIAIDDAAIDCPSGETLTITGEGFIPNEPAVRIFFDGEEIARVFPSDEGTFSVTVDPPGAAAGEHTIQARQFVAAEEPDEIVASATLTCVAGAAVAFTGANISMGLILLAALIIVGVAALVAARRRSRATTA
jgi:IPT/TIG domain